MAKEKKKRKSGEGTVRLRKDGRWEGRIVTAYDKVGKPITKNVLAKTEAECVKKLEDLKKSLGVVKSKVSPDMPFGDWIDYWYQNFGRNNLGAYTRNAYEQRIYKQIIPRIGDIPLKNITTGTLEKFYVYLKNDGRLIRRETYGPGLSPSTIKDIHAHCYTALERAKNDGLIKQNPADLCRLPASEAKEIQTLTTAEMQRLLIQAKEDGFYEMFLLDLSTGLRRGELLGLQWDDIDFEKRELKVDRQVRFEKKKLVIAPPKTKAAYRTIVLPEELVEVLKEYRTRVRSKWLFPSPTKHEDVPRDPNSCRKKLSTILERAQCKHVPFHALRHTFASQSLRYGMDIKTLAATIGHESVETTLDVYSHITDEGMANAAKTIEKTMGSAVGSQSASKGKKHDKSEDAPAEKAPTPMVAFEPYKGKKRKPGTGYVKQLSARCWQGRYTPTINGTRISHNVYGATEDECEAKLAELISRVKAEHGIA